MSVDWDGQDWDGMQTQSIPDVPRDWEWHYPESDEEYGEPVRRTWANVLNGRIPLSALDNEELIHMRLRNRNGKIPTGGGGPTRLPQGLRRERARLLAEMAEDSDISFLLKAVKLRQDLVEDVNVDPAVRLRAAVYSEERARGKVPDRVEMAVAVAPWEGLVGDILVDVPAGIESPGGVTAIDDILEEEPDGQNPQALEPGHRSDGQGEAGGA